MEAMQPLRAHVRNGRLVLDEPTDLAEGQIVELVPIDEVLAHRGDDLDDEERQRLHQSLERGLADVKAGRTVEAGTVIEKLRARAERHAVIAERVARVQSGDATTLSMEEVERSLRDELDLPRPVGPTS